MSWTTAPAWQRACQELVGGGDIETHRRGFHFDLTAFVFMPEHVHLLIRPRLEHYDVTRFRAAVKKSVTKRAVAFLKDKHPEELATLEVASGVYRFWQDGPGFDRNLRSDEAIRASIEYFHRNPVTRKLCDSVEAYKWSSARAYYGLPSVLPVNVWQPYCPEIGLGRCRRSEGKGPVSGALHAQKARESG